MSVNFKNKKSATCDIPTTRTTTRTVATTTTHHIIMQFCMNREGRKYHGIDPMPSIVGLMYMHSFINTYIF